MYDTNVKVYFYIKKFINHSKTWVPEVYYLYGTRLNILNKGKSSYCSLLNMYHKYTQKQSNQLFVNIGTKA
jgi:hypothetical protein